MAFDRHVLPRCRHLSKPYQQLRPHERAATDCRPFEPVARCRQNLGEAITHFRKSTDSSCRAGFSRGASAIAMGCFDAAVPPSGQPPSRQMSWARKTGRAAVCPFQPFSRLTRS